MTELIWDGKYKDGKKQGPVRIALPFQTIETVNESAQDRHRNLELFSSGRDTEWRNRLIWGDKKYVLPSLLPEFAGSVNLIYIDPPFDTGADFSHFATVPPTQGEPDDSVEFLKRPSVIEQKAYRDTWGRGLDSYLQWFYDTIVLLRELLHAEGSIFVHLDWHVGHYAKVVLDDVFGADRFRNEIVWSYRKLARTANQFPKSHDTILFYSKGESNAFNVQHVELAESTLKRWGDRKRGGKNPNERYATDEESQGAVMPDVWPIPLPIGANPQKTGYPTQKPEALLERIITASSNKGELILDCFGGSGTSVAVAEKLSRRWRGEGEKAHAEGTLFLTNIQQFYERQDRSADDEPEAMTAVLGSKPPTKKLEMSDFTDRIALRAGHLLVVNDEAHHTHDEASEWNSVIRRLHGKTPLTAQLDFSATPRFQKGAIFPWTISDYPLKQAIVHGIVKRPTKGIARVDEAKSDHASVRYQAYLAAGVERWREYRDQLKLLRKKPILFVMMNSTEEADDVADWLRTKYPGEFGDEKTQVIHTKSNGDIRGYCTTLRKTIMKQAI